MLNEILNAMARTLKGIDREREIEVNIGELKQGFVAPCFFIRQLNHSHTLVVGDRYRRTYHFDVEYHSAARAGAELTRELAAMGEALLMALEYIDADSGKIRGENISFHAEDGVLHVFVDYTVFVRLVKERAPLMMTLELDVKPKKE